MSLNSIFLGYAASGANITIMQWGGAAYTDDTFLYPNLGVVAPLLWCTGNKHTYRACQETMDYTAAGIIEGTETIEEAGDRLFELVKKTASGGKTKSETLKFQEANKIYFQEGAF
jgi:altronate dehydratase large subunit